MPNIPYYPNPGGPLTVHVELQNAADVYLVDQNNFNKQHSGQSFTYFGGHQTRTPVEITVNGSGNWYLIVDDGGAGSQYSYNWIK